MEGNFESSLSLFCSAICGQSGPRGRAQGSSAVLLLCSSWSLADSPAPSGGQSGTCV
jgi:hypothetical protein